MMTDDHNDNRWNYEQFISFFFYEANLLFTRLNFFMTGMSFLIAALVLVLTQWNDNNKEARTITYFIIIALGFLLSFLFLVLNRISTGILKAIRDKAFTLGDQIYKDPSLYKAPLNIFPVLNPKYKPEGTTGLMGCIKGEIEKLNCNHPAPHTWFIPAIFLVFWIIMVGVYIDNVWNWDKEWIWWLLIGALIVRMLLCAWKIAKYFQFKSISTD